MFMEIGLKYRMDHRAERQRRFANPATVAALAAAATAGRHSARQCRGHAGRGRDQRSTRRAGLAASTKDPSPHSSECASGPKRPTESPRLPSRIRYSPAIRPR
jgi:hypothetical protein